MASAEDTIYTILMWSHPGGPRSTFHRAGLVYIYIYIFTNINSTYFQKTTNKLL